MVYLSRILCISYGFLLWKPLYENLESRLIFNTLAEYMTICRPSLAGITIEVFKNVPLGKVLKDVLSEGLP